MQRQRKEKYFKKGQLDGKWKRPIQLEAEGPGEVFSPNQVEPPAKLEELAILERAQRVPRQEFQELLSPLERVSNWELDGPLPIT